MKKKDVKRKEIKRKKFPLERKNYLLLLIGLLCIIVGFFFLAKGDITLAPILLVAGYCVFIPFAMFFSFKKAKIKEKKGEGKEKTTG